MHILNMLYTFPAISPSLPVAFEKPILVIRLMDKGKWNTSHFMDWVHGRCC